MLKYNADKLMTASTCLAGVIKLFEVANRQLIENKKNIFYHDKQQNDIILSILKSIEKESETLLIPISNRKSLEIWNSYGQFLMCQKNITQNELAQVIGDFKVLSHLIVEELKNLTFMYLGAKNSELYNNPLDFFGEQILESFPESQFDLEEAGKCYSLGRFTASVFHLMRAMESAVEPLAKKLNVTIKNKYHERLSWGVVNSNLKDSIAALPKGEDKDSWEKVNILLHGVNRAWRTKTAHPVATYTKEQANDIRNAVCGFMNEMSERI